MEIDSWDSPQGVLRPIGELLFGDATKAREEVNADPVVKYYFRGGQYKSRYPEASPLSVPTVTLPMPR